MYFITEEEARESFEHVVTEAESGNTSVVIRDGKPVAMVVPYDPEFDSRLAFSLTGRVTGAV